MDRPNVPTLFLPVIVCKATVTDPLGRVDLSVINVGPLSRTKIVQQRRDPSETDSATREVFTANYWKDQQLGFSASVSESGNAPKRHLHGLEAASCFDSGEAILSNIDGITRQFRNRGTSPERVDEAIQTLRGAVGQLNDMSMALP